MRRLIFLLYFISTFLYSCNQTAEKNIDSNFVLCLFNKDESPTSFLLVESLEEEESASVQIPLSTSRIREREYIQKNRSEERRVGKECRSRVAASSRNE